MDIKEILNSILKKITLRLVMRILFYVVMFVLVIMAARFLLRSTGIKKYNPEENYAAEEDEEDFPAFTADPGDLKIPDIYLNDPEFSWRPFRKTPEKWSEEEIKRFWKDPADVIIEAYSDENREYVEKILEEVP